MPTETLTHHDLDTLLTLPLADLEALWELVPTDRQRRYQDRLAREVRLQGAHGSDAGELRVVNALIDRFRTDALVPVGERWAKAPQRIRDAAQSGEPLIAPESTTVSQTPGLSPLVVVVVVGLLFACLLGFLLLGRGGDSQSPAETAAVMGSPTARYTATPTPIALVESDFIIRDGDTDRALAYPIGLQILQAGQQPRVFVVQRRRVDLSEWRYDPNPDTASFLSDLPVQHVIGIPHSEDNAALFASLDTDDVFVLRQNTGGELRFRFAERVEVRRTDTSYFRQLGPGLVLVLIGERDEDGLPTRDRVLIRATYDAEQELSREGVLLAGETLPTPAATPIPTQTPVPSDPREHLHVSLISVEHSRERNLLRVELRLYNDQNQPVTLHAEDFRLALGYAENPPGPSQSATGLQATTVRPGQALDVTLWWPWNGEPFGGLRVLGFAFGVALD